MHQLKNNFGIYILVALCLSGNCIAEPIAKPSDKYQLAHINMTNAVNKIRALDSKKLWQLLSGTEYDVPLSEISTKAPEIWVDRIAALIFLHELWVDSGMYTRESGAEEIFGDVSVITKKVADNCLLRSEAFAELCRRKDERVWEFMNQRAKKSPSILDLCIAGWVTWGTDVFMFIPSDGAESLDPFSRRRCGVDEILPVVSRDKLQNLLKGDNGIYRWLAIEKMDSWKVGDDGLWMLQRAISDDFHVVRLHGLDAVKRLPVEERIRILEQAIAIRKKTLVDAERQEIERLFTSEMRQCLADAKHQNGNSVDGK